MAWPLTWIRGRLAKAELDARPEPDLPAEIDEPKPTLGEPNRPNVLLISVIGLGEAERDGMLDWMIEDCKGSGKLPVFITDDLNLAPWLTRELVVEHLPSLDRQRPMAPDLDWDLYIKRRLDFLKRKWSVEHIVDLGKCLGSLIDNSAAPPTDLDHAKTALGSS